MPDHCTVIINGAAARVKSGTSVAAAVLNAGIFSFRRSVSGETRAPLCGMGVCFECRLTIDGVPHARSCQILCREGMRVDTDG
jgi:predicted molibdopterin-dependent oxidoreductase YjgC